MTRCDIYCGDALTELRKLPAESVQCCVTSPPYWGLRDYGTAKWEGGDPACDHVIQATGSTQNKGCNGGMAVARGDCPKCGARRIDQQLGLESTPQEYVAKLVEIFREVRRVLRGDGVLWLNLGDSYCSQGGTHDDRGDNQPGVGASRAWRDGAGRADGIVDERGQRNRNGNTVPGLKPKDLVGIPWRVAFALQADGWWLRQDVIWSKPNPMPESVTDRCTKAHEYIFLLSKAASYYYDAGAVAEQSICTEDPRFGGPRIAYDAKTGPTANPEYQGQRRAVTIRETRNRRSVWGITTKPYAEAHFATFPPEIPRICIMAGSKPGDTILDPFGGSGTTGEVAQELGRHAILIELNPTYCELIKRRTAQVGMVLP